MCVYIRTDTEETTEWRWKQFLSSRGMAKSRYCKLSTKCAIERMLKIGLYLAEILWRNLEDYFFDHPVCQYYWSFPFIDRPKDTSYFCAVFPVFFVKNLFVSH